MNSFRWTQELTIVLIKERNTEEMKKVFNDPKPKYNALNKSWEQIAASVSPLCTGTKAADKYSKILCRFRKEASETRRTGAAPSSWPYYEIFTEVLPEGATENPSVRMIVSGENTGLVYEDNGIKIDKPPRVNKTSKLKTNVLSALSVLLEKEASKLDNDNKEKTEFTKLEDVKRVETKIDELSNVIAMFLNSQNKENKKDPN